MTGRIVVGVDGSEGSIAALRWALEEARLRDATLEVVHAWRYPYVGDVAGMATYATVENELERRGQEVLDRSVEAAGAAPAGLQVNRIQTHGGAASVLLDSAKGADLLVIG